MVSVTGVITVLLTLLSTLAVIGATNPMQNEKSAPPRTKLAIMWETELNHFEKNEAKIDIGARSTSTEIIFFEGQEGMLLFWYDCKNLGILPDNYPTPIPLPVNTLSVEARSPTIKINEPSRAEIEEIKKNILDEYKDVFDTSGPL